MGPWAYWLSMKKCRFVRRVQDMFSGVRFPGSGGVSRCLS